MKWALLIAGVAAALYAWQIRQPLTTADFTLFYRSAQLPAARMYEPPPGPPRNNMNPPQFQLLLEPLVRMPLPLASAVFRALSIASLIVCLWWIARTSNQRWDVGDVGALLAWTPMAAMLSLNQVAWIMWPLLVATLAAWRANRWIAGAVAYGVALSLKPFLGIVLLWLLVSRRFRPAVVACAAAGAVYLVAIAVYGVDVFRAWLGAVGNVQWWWVGINASLEGMLARLLTPPRSNTTTLPPIVAPLAALGGIAIVAVTLVRTRKRNIDDSWPALIAAALMASPLGWVYYAWWILPVERPSRLLIHAPMLWLPVAYVAFPQDSPAVAATLGSAYFWGLTAIWIRSLRSPSAAAPARDDDRGVAAIVEVHGIEHRGRQ